MASMENETKSFVQRLGLAVDWLERALASEVRRFLLGSVIIPLILATGAVTVGAYVAHEFQLREHKFEASMQAQKALEKAALDTRYGVKKLVDDIADWEISRANLKITPALDTFANRLNELEAQSLRLREVFSWNTEGVEIQLQLCRAQLDKAQSCAVDAAPLRPRIVPNCSNDFDVAACEDLSLAAFRAAPPNRR